MTLDINTTIDLAKYVGAGFCIGLGAIGAALGEGYTAGLASQGMSQKPEKSGDILKNMHWLLLFFFFSWIYPVGVF